MTDSNGRTSEAIEQRGFAAVGLLNAAEVAAASVVASSLQIDPTATFYASNVHATRDQATAACDRLLRITEDAVHRTFPGRRAVKAVVIAKAPVGDNWVNLHQDWDYVDERSERAHVAWCPLQDTGHGDGLLHVVPGSHRWLDNRRGSGAFPLPFEPHEALLVPAGEAVEVGAGEAIVYDTAALHFSPPNDGERMRVAIGLVLVGDQVPVVHLHSVDGHTAELHQVDPRRFTSRPFGERPPGAPADVVELSTSPLSPEDIHGFLARIA